MKNLFKTMESCKDAVVIEVQTIGSIVVGVVGSEVLKTMHDGIKEQLTEELRIQKKVDLLKNH